MATSFRFLMGLFVLYITPILILLVFSKKIDRHFLRNQLKCKTADLLVPFLLMGIYLFSSDGLVKPYFPYFLLFLFTFGILLVTALYFKVNELHIRQFLFVWWRFVFLFSFLLFYTTGGILISKLI